MTVVPATFEEAGEAAGPDRIAWNPPRRPLMEVRTSPGSPAPAPPHELASSSSAIVPLDQERLHADEAALHGLDWQGFLARHFPGRRRHDLEALIAYGAYKSSNVAGRQPGEVVRLEESKPSSPESTATDTWADDGGTTR